MFRWYVYMSIKDAGCIRAPRERNRVRYRADAVKKRQLCQTETKIWFR